MKRQLLGYWVNIALLLLLGTTVAAAQVNTCSPLVETALRAVDEACAETSRNQACYANVSLEAVPQAGVPEFRFEASGDIVDVNDVASLKLSPMNVETGEWGVVVMELQANIPATLPGQNVTFILFGDVEVTNATSPEQVASGEAVPMQAFYLTSGIGSVGCEEVPENGLLVQTPDGVGEITFTVNEVQVEMGSTVLFQAQPEGEMTVTTIEGSAVLNVGGSFHPVVAGTLLRLAVDRDLRPLEVLGLPEAYDEAIERRLPVIPALEREIEVRPPLNQEQIERLHELINSGQPPCGQDPLPSCDRVPASVGGGACVLGVLLPGDQRTPCDEAPLRPQDDQGNGGIRPRGTREPGDPNSGASGGEGDNPRLTMTRPPGMGPTMTRPPGMGPTATRPPGNSTGPTATRPPGNSTGPTATRPPGNSTGPTATRPPQEPTRPPQEPTRPPQEPTQQPRPTPEATRDTVG